MEQDDTGAVHLIEAALAAALVIAALFYVNSLAPSPGSENSSGVEDLSSDLLNVLLFRGNSLEHPSLGFTLSSRAQWSDSSGALSLDILNMLPAGTYYYLETPYGTLGQKPAPGAALYLRPFIVCDDDGEMLDCKLTLWRA